MDKIHRRKQWKIILVFLTPAVFLYALLVVYPYIRGMQTSFYQWNGFTSKMNFIGFANYKKLLADPYVFKSLGHNGFMFLASLITLTLGLVIASTLTGKTRGSKVYRIVYFFPNVMSIAVIAVLWSLVLSPNFGLLNTLLRSIGLKGLARTWLGPDYALRSVGVISIWAGFGWFMILFIAGIQNIPRTLYEAAEIDGATPIYSFIKITVPLIWELLRTAFLYNVIVALNQFALVFILFDQRSNPHTDMVANYFYWQAFENYNFGYATAIVMLLFIITLIASLLSWRLTKAQTVSY